MDERSADRRLVFGDDLTSGSDLAWLWVSSQRWPGWHLVVVEADPPPLGSTVPPEQSSVHPSAGPPSRSVFAEAAFTSVEFCEATADPRVVLSDDLGADLLVVGPASGGLGPWHIGSTTEWLLNDPPAPLVVARTGRSVRRVLVAADGSPHALAAATALTDLPWVDQTEATVLTVDDGAVSPDASVELVDRLEAAGARVHAERAKGDAHRAVLAEATTGYDLVVLGTRGSSGLERLRLGSTASAVVRHAPCSVLVAQADDA